MNYYEQPLSDYELEITVVQSFEHDYNQSIRQLQRMAEYTTFDLIQARLDKLNRRHAKVAKSYRHNVDALEYLSARIEIKILPDSYTFTKVSQ